MKRFGRFLQNGDIHADITKENETKIDNINKKNTEMKIIAENKYDLTIDMVILELINCNINII
jgi:hypothetical protein